MRRVVRGGTLFSRAVWFQVAASAILCSLLAIYVSSNYAAHWDPKISIASFVAIPAAVIAVAQLMISAQIQRASYIKDYALRFRTDKELSESFHYLVYRFGNDYYRDFIQSVKTPESQKVIDDAQAGLGPDLRFFNPKAAVGSPQERRLDNLLGFFDTLGYDLSRGLIHVRDVAGVFGYHLDHFIQRKVVQDYLAFVKEKWPELETFHEQYKAPVPFRYFRHLLHQYAE